MNRFRQLGLIDYNAGLEPHSSPLDIVLHEQRFSSGRIRAQHVHNWTVPGFMNQFRCKQFNPTVVVGFTMLIVGFSTVTVEKVVSFQAETTVQLWTSTDQWPKPHRLRVGKGGDNFSPDGITPSNGG
jgi:hypothetical protein